MKRTAWRMILGVGLVGNTGCLSTIAGSLATEPPVHGSEQAAKEAKTLPSKESAEICVALGADLEKSGFFGDAVLQYEKARGLDPRYKSLGRRMAVLYDQVGEERKAVAEFDEAVKRTPKDADVWNDFGYCHYNHGRWSEAETCFRKAVGLSDQNPRANVNLGLTLAQQGKYDESFKTFSKVNRPAEAKANVAFVLAAQGKTDEAKKLYHEALAIEPGLTTAQQALAALAKPAGPKPPAAAAPKPANSAKLCPPGECVTPETAPDLPPLVIERQAQPR